MSFPAISKQQNLAQTNSSQPQIVEVEQSPSIQSNEHHFKGFESSIALTIASIALVLLLCSLKMTSFKTVRKRTASVRSSSPKIPCYNCRFFDNNPHLKCAIQPSLVLSEEAFNCPDYTKNLT
jgi:hypothetical protein